MQQNGAEPAQLAAQRAGTASRLVEERAARRLPALDAGLRAVSGPAEGSRKGSADGAGPDRQVAQQRRLHATGDPLAALQPGQRCRSSRRTCSWCSRPARSGSSGRACGTTSTNGSRPPRQNKELKERFQYAQQQLTAANNQPFVEDWLATEAGNAGKQEQAAREAAGPRSREAAIGQPGLYAVLRPGRLLLQPRQRPAAGRSATAYAEMAKRFPQELRRRLLVPAGRHELQPAGSFQGSGPAHAFAGAAEARHQLRHLVPADARRRSDQGRRAGQAQLRLDQQVERAVRPGPALRRLDRRRAGEVRA